MLINVVNFFENKIHLRIKSGVSLFLNISRHPLMEDDLKILKLKYYSNPLLDHTQILNLSLEDQTILYKL